MRKPHRRIQERFSRRPLELPPLFGQRLPPAAACLRLQLGQSVSSTATAASVARYKSKLCAPSSSKSALAFVKLRAASGFISPRAGPGKPCSANSRSLSIPASLLLGRQSLCLARQARSLLQKLSHSIAMQHFVLTAVFQHLARRLKRHKNQKILAPKTKLQLS